MGGGDLWGGEGMDELKERLEKLALWELLSVFEDALAVKVAAFERWESAIGDHKQITDEAKAAAILALLKA